MCRPRSSAVPCAAPHIAAPAIILRIGWLTMSLSVTFCAQRVISRTCMWSCRSLPTPGASSTTRCRAASANPPARRPRAAAVAANYTRRWRPEFPCAPARCAGGLPACIRQPGRDALRTRCAAPAPRSRHGGCGGSWPGADRRKRVLARRPLRVVVWKNPAPSCVAPLKSGLVGIPASAAATTKASDSGSAWRQSDTGSGPPLP